MSRFLQTSPLTIAAWKRDDGTPIWITSEPISFALGDDTSPWSNTCVFIVPRGFETDLGSIPAWLRWLFNPASSRCARAYVLHDYINSLTRGRPPGPGVWSSQVAAGILYDAMALDGEPVWSRLLQWAGVCLAIAKGER